MAAADEWLTGLLGDAGPGIALVAVGAYGRQEPALGSDLDLVLVHDGKQNAKAHRGDRRPDLVSGVGQRDRPRPQRAHHRRGARRRRHDLKAAMGLLDARHVAGDASSRPS